MIIKILVATLFLAGCANYTKMSHEEAIAYQADQLIKTTQLLYASRPSIPDGDLTKNVVMAGGANVTTPDIYREDSLANIRDRDAMLRLHPDTTSGLIRNEFGGLVRVIARGGKVSVIYTNVPSTVSCNDIPNVLCGRHPG